jgi:hypothetical protein
MVNGGLMQLVSYGMADIYYCGNPQAGVNFYGNYSNRIPTCPSLEFSYISAWSDKRSPFGEDISNNKKSMASIGPLYTGKTNDKLIEVYKQETGISTGFRGHREPDFYENLVKENKTDYTDEELEELELLSEQVPYDSDDGLRTRRDNGSRNGFWLPIITNSVENPTILMFKEEMRQKELARKKESERLERIRKIWNGME